MPGFMDDADIIDPNTIESTGPSYPIAQWNNGDPKMAAAGGVAHTGGLILPTKYVDDQVAPPPGWARANVAFSSGKTETVLAAQKARLAVVRTRFRWFVRANGVTTYYPRSGFVAGANMRGHVQALCSVYGFDFPIVVTFKGKASQEFERLLKEFSEKVQGAAAKLGSKKFPRFAFYMRLAPGLHVKAGQKGAESIITPPVMELPEVITEDYLGKIYVGRENLLAYQGWYHEAAEWAAQWDKVGAEESDVDHGASWDEEPPSARANPATGEITERAPAPKSDETLWEEFCVEHAIKRSDVAKALKFPTPGAYLKAHPEDTLQGAMKKILAGREAKPAPQLDF